MKVSVLLVFAVFVFMYSSALLVSAETVTSVWRDEMNYQSIDALQAGGWTVTHQEGIGFSGEAIILDGTSQDTAIHYSNHFSLGISDWKVEDKSRWTMGSHCGNSVTAITDKHSYAFMADGWYSNYAFYRDGQKTTFDNFQENKNTWLTLAIEKQGNQINMYHNGELKSTYTETDTSPSQLVAVDAVSPWRGGAEYDYFEVYQITDTSTQEAQQSLLSNPIVIGGIIGAVGVGIGGVLYFFVLGGAGSSGGAGAATGGAAGGSGSAGGSSGATTNTSSSNSPHPAYATLTAHLQDLQIQSQAMHTAAANLMNDPHTVGAGSAMQEAAQIVDNTVNSTVIKIPPAAMPGSDSSAPSIFTQGAADALMAASVALHSAGSNLLSNANTASTGTALQATAADLKNTAQSLLNQIQANKPPTVQQIPHIETTNSSQTSTENNPGTDYSGDNPPANSNAA